MAVTSAREADRAKFVSRTATLQVGDAAPEFTLRSHDGRTYSLAELRGTRVVLAFFPFAFTGT